MTEIKIEMAGIKDLEKNGGITAEEMAYVGSQGHVIESCGIIRENDGIEKE